MNVLPKPDLSPKFRGSLNVDGKRNAHHAGVPALAGLCGLHLREWSFCGTPGSARPKGLPVKVLPTELYVGVKISLDYPAQGPYNTLNPSERRDLWGDWTVYVCTLTYLPTSFHYLGNQGDVFFRYARASVSVKETFGVRFEPVTWTTSNVKVLPAEL